MLLFISLNISSHVQLQTLSAGGEGGHNHNQGQGQRGVVITGGAGVGKTTIIEQLVQSSLFSARRDQLVSSASCTGE
jgi:putative ribosome biogenesis GTPase RsgA